MKLESKYFIPEESEDDCMKKGCTWEESDTICNKLSGHLAKITNKADSNSLIKSIEDFELDGVRFHIGLYNPVNTLHLPILPK